MTFKTPITDMALRVPVVCKTPIAKSGDDAVGVSYPKEDLSASIALANQILDDLQRGIDEAEAALHRK